MYTIRHEATSTKTTSIAPSHQRHPATDHFSKAVQALGTKSPEVDKLARGN